jgi:hypothetical protein
MMIVDSDGHVAAIDGLWENSLRMKPRVGILKLPKLVFSNQTTTVIFGWTRGNNRWSSGEITPDEIESRDLETLKA